jgi:hypothetical protein
MTAQSKAKKGPTMAEKQELSVREKKELVAKEEKTVPGRYYVPYADARRPAGNARRREEGAQRRAGE